MIRTRTLKTQIKVTGRKKRFKIILQKVDFSLMLLRCVPSSSTQVTGEMLEKQLRWCSIRHKYCQCWAHFKLRLPVCEVLN